MLDFLKKKAAETGIPLLCAKCKDGSWVIYIKPGAKDTMNLMLNAAMEIEKENQ